MSLQKDTKNCYKCGLQIALNAKFCTQCGANLQAAQKTTFKDCPECGSQLPSKSNFCENCGIDLKSKDSSRIYSDKQDALKPLYCERGCGGILLETDDPGIFNCKYCGRKYLVKREGASLKIVKEIKEIKESVSGLTNTQNIFTEKENARIELKELEEANNDFHGSFLTRLFKFVNVIALPGGFILFLISLLFSSTGAHEAVFLFRIATIFFIIPVFLFVYLRGHKNNYEKRKKELLQIIDKKI